MSKPSAERAPACVILEAKGIPQTDIAAAWECSPSNVSKILSGEHRPTERRKVIARERWGVPIEAWILESELHPEQAAPAEPPPMGQP